jgi:hypothetical protein
MNTPELIGDNLQGLRKEHLEDFAVGVRLDLKPPLAPPADPDAAQPKSQTLRGNRGWLRP